VARDRQRSKGRRKRPGGNPAGKQGGGQRAKDAGLGEGSVEDAGLGDSGVEDAGLGEAPAPDDVLDVGQSHAAVPGVTGETPRPVEDFGDEDLFEDDDFDRAPDELEGDLVPSGGGRLDPAVAAERAEKPHKERGRLLTFLRHCVEELRRVQWPDRKHVGQATAVVLGFVLVAGGYLGLMDAIWQPVVNAIL
jgi:preprotein translocase SecE subunit